MSKLNLDYYQEFNKMIMPKILVRTCELVNKTTLLFSKI